MRINQFLTSASLCAALLAIAGCTDDNQITGTNGDDGETGTPIPLTIRTTKTNFEGLPEADTSSPVSTHATDNGTTTTFVAGDKIGIFAVTESGEVFGGIENTCLTYEIGTDGTGEWKAPDGVELYYHPDITYFVYYPYQQDLTFQDVTIDLGLPEAFGWDLSRQSRFRPPMDQSDPATYARYDLMTAYGKPTIGTIPTERILNLKFIHQQAVFILIPTVEVVCVPPDEDKDAYSYYADNNEIRVPVTDTKVTSATMYDPNLWGENPKLCKMDDGSYRLLISFYALTSGVSFNLNGSYNTTESNGSGSWVKWTGTAIPNIEPGKSYILRVNSQKSALANEEYVRRVAPGDYVYFDGYYKKIYVIPGNCVGEYIDFTQAEGIVVTSDPARMTDPKCIENGWTHAYVMPLLYQWNYLEEVTWDNEVDGPLSNLTTYNDVRNDMNGYASTETLYEDSYGSYYFLNKLRKIRAERNQDTYPLIPGSEYIGEK